MRTGGRLTFFACAKKVSKESTPQPRQNRSVAPDTPARRFDTICYGLDEAEKEGILDRINAEKKRGKIQVTRFKGLGEMNPLQLRETTMDPSTRTFGTTDH